jgi:hypothetical protein
LASDMNCRSWRICSAWNIVKCTTGVEHVDQPKRRKPNNFAENLV